MNGDIKQKEQSQRSNIKSQIELFRKRAKRLRCKAGVFLFFIILILICGGGIFIFASQIPMQDIKAVSKTKENLISKLKSELSEIEESNEQIAKERSDLLNNIKPRLLGGGRIWHSQETGVNNYLFCGHFFNEYTGLVGGSNGIILITRDGGVSWKRLKSETIYQINWFHFVNDKTGWAGGIGGRILKTRDGGESWNIQNAGVKSDFRNAYFHDKKTGYLVGRAGIILVTSDGGATWKRQNTNTKHELYWVHFFDLNNGLSGGNLGTLLATKDGGKTWTKKKTGLDGDLVWVFFVNNKIGWTGGSRGTILATKDGGNTWVQQGTNKGYNFYWAHFSDGKTGWVGGNKGTILKTKDGGESWERQETGVNSHLNWAHFSDGKTGWVGGNKGTILKTKDGGESWERQETGVNSHLNWAHFVNERTGWVVGSEGIVLATKDFDMNLDLLNSNDEILSILAKPGIFAVLRGTDYYSRFKAIADKQKINKKLKPELENTLKVLKPDKKPQAISVTDPFFLISTNLTRFGALLIVIFLVQIMINIYRYNRRLAGYYDARADALLLLDDIEGGKLNELIDSLSPEGINFGKTPQTPTHQMMEFVEKFHRIKEKNK